MDMTQEELLDQPIVQTMQRDTSPPPLDKNKPVQILIRDSDNPHKFHLDDDSLRQILSGNPETASLPIAVLSVAGAFRKGKSFLINLFMNYLKHNEITENIPMLFSWRGGAKRDTTGILAWPELFVLHQPDGKKYALLIMDTQGTFDEESSVRDNATIFALSCMTSSKIIYNLSQQIQEDNLQHLELFTNYGELALESGQTKPFQSLCFLVRDWSCPADYAYGRDTLSEANDYDACVSGSTYLQKKLLVKENTHPDLQSVRQHIRDCFEKAECFLLPHPGLKVSASPKFSGQTNMIEPEFLSEVKKMFNSIKKELRPKKVDGKEITSSQLVHFFQGYAKIFDEQDLPEPRSLLQATAEASLLGMHTELVSAYEKEMKASIKACGNKTFSNSEFQQLTTTITGKVVTKFDAMKKLGSADVIKKFRTQLEESLETSSSRFREQNDTKRIAASWKTPATFVTLNFTCAVIAALLNMLWLGPIGVVFSIVAYIGWLLVGIWSFALYTDQWSLLRERIDELSDFIAVHLLSMGFDWIRGQAANQGFNAMLAQIGVDQSTTTSKKDD